MVDFGNLNVKINRKKTKNSERTHRLRILNKHPVRKNLIMQIDMAM